MFRLVKDIIEILLLSTNKSIITTSSTIRTYDGRTKQIPIRVLAIHDGESRAVIGETDRLQQDALCLARKALDLFDVTS
ncbi:hypothetical protein C4D60_Mb01t08640 [Musa balbisiana]|uniref:Uncharacterized protein n=1 Tax=Musa balbisiana TaxID=52838 RepID=A0A4S8JL38_MUSBA|nr:hypothetical protein C4D60_Mb01t08640 [Musa balbisiana]